MAVATRDSAGSHVYVDAGSGTDQLVVDGTDLREDVTLDDSSESGYTERITSASWTPTKQSATTIDQTGIETVLVRTYGGGDRVLVRRLPSATPHTIDVGSADDQVLVGTNASFTGNQLGVTNAGGTLNSVRSALTVLGGAGTDTLSFDDTGDNTANTGVLTRSLLTGLGLSAAGATYTDLEWLDIDLGTGNDRLDVLSTHGEAGTPIRTKRTDITTGGGNDTVNIRTIDGPTSVDLGSGANTVNVGSLAPTTGGRLPQRHPGPPGADRPERQRHPLRRRRRHRGGRDRIGAVTGTRITGLGMTFDSSWNNPDGTLALPDLVQVVRVLNAQSGRFRLSVAGPLGTRTTADLYLRRHGRRRPGRARGHPRRRQRAGDQGRWHLGDQLPRRPGRCRRLGAHHRDGHHLDRRVAQAGRGRRQDARGDRHGDDGRLDRLLRLRSPDCSPWAAATTC